MRLDDELRDGYIKVQICHVYISSILFDPLLILIYKSQINQWLRDHKYPTLPIPVICNYIPLVRERYDPMTTFHANNRDKKVLDKVQ